MCITNTTSLIDFDAAPPEKLREFKKVMEERKKELKSHLKALDGELSRLGKAEQLQNAQKLVRLHNTK